MMKKKSQIIFQPEKPANELLLNSHDNDAEIVLNYGFLLLLQRGRHNNANDIIIIIFLLSPLSLA